MLIRFSQIEAWRFYYRRSKLFIRSQAQGFLIHTSIILLSLSANFYDSFLLLVILTLRLETLLSQQFILRGQDKETSDSCSFFFTNWLARRLIWVLESSTLSTRAHIFYTRGFSKATYFWDTLILFFLFCFIEFPLFPKRIAEFVLFSE